MAYQDIKGTTAETFKIGRKGISLSSKAIRNPENNKLIKKYLVASYKNDAGEKEEYKLLYDFDVEIPNVDLAKIGYSTDSEGNKIIVFALASGGTIELPLTMTGVKGPETSTPDAIATFADESGKVLQDSGRKFSDSIDIKTEEDNKNSKDIPSVSAVVGYVGAISDIVTQRMDGEL